MCWLHGNGFPDDQYCQWQWPFLGIADFSLGPFAADDRQTTVDQRRLLCGQHRSSAMTQAIGMNHELKNLFANVREKCPWRPTVKSVALLGMRGDHEPMYMMVRFCDFDSQDIEGDHLMFSLEEAMDSSREEFGILESDWRTLRPEEVDAIPEFIGGIRVRRFTLVKACRQPSSLAELEHDEAFCLDEIKRVAETLFGPVEWGQDGLAFACIDSLAFQLETRIASLSISSHGPGDIVGVIQGVAHAAAKHGIVCIDVQRSALLVHSDARPDGGK